MLSGLHSSLTFVPLVDLLVLELWEPGRIWDRSPGQMPLSKGE